MTLAQLPRSVRDYAIEAIPAGPDLSVRRDGIDADVAALLGVSLERASRVPSA